MGQSQNEDSKKDSSLAASRLSSILSDIMVSNDPVGWLRLFRFPSRCFKAHVRGGKRRNLTSWVKAQINEEADPPIEAESSGRRWSTPVSSDPDSRLASRVSSKLGAGDLKGAIRLVCSNDSLANIDSNTFEALKSKQHSGTILYFKLLQRSKICG